MTTTTVSLGLAFLVTLLFMFALLPMARSLGLIDRPGGRKNHLGDIPVLGGLAMCAGLIVTMPFAYDALKGFPFFLVSLLLLVVIGALDDRFDLPAFIRLLAQTCAALLMAVGADVVVQDIGAPFFGGLAELGWFSGLFTVLIVLTAINAFNMFDGSDGVAGIQALIGLVFLGFACIMSGMLGHLPFVACLIGSVLAFLIFNWPSARTREMRAFMGDAGSTMLGFTLAWLAIELSQGETRAISPAATLWLFALPLYDFFSSMVRRILDGRSPFHGDSEHLHHVLRRFGMSSRRVAQAILLGSAVLAGIGVAGHLRGVPDGVLFISWLVLGGIYHLIFASGLVIRRREIPREDEGTSSSGIYSSLWRQHRPLATHERGADADAQRPD